MESQNLIQAIDGDSINIITTKGDKQVQELSYSTSENEFKVFVPVLTISDGKILLVSKKIRLYSSSSNKISFVSDESYKDYEKKKNCKSDKRIFRICVDTNKKIPAYNQLTNKVEDQNVLIKFALEFP